MASKPLSALWMYLWWEIYCGVVCPHIERGYGPLLYLFVHRARILFYASERTHTDTLSINYSCSFFVYTHPLPPYRSDFFNKFKRLKGYVFPPKRAYKDLPRRMRSPLLSSRKRGRGVAHVTPFSKSYRLILVGWQLLYKGALCPRITLR